MEFVVGYFVIGALLAWVYWAYFKDEPSPVNLRSADIAFGIFLLWLPLIFLVVVCAIAAAIIDYFVGGRGE